MRKADLLRAVGRMPAVLVDALAEQAEQELEAFEEDVEQGGNLRALAQQVAGE